MCVCVSVCVCARARVCSLRYPACNAHVPHYHLQPVPLCIIFPHGFINGTIFEKAFEDKSVF